MTQLQINQSAIEAGQRRTMRQHSRRVGRVLQPQFPIHEEIDATTLQIATCQSQPHVWVKPFVPSAPSTLADAEYRQVEVCRRHNPKQAYQIIDSFKPQRIDHGSNVTWGHLYVGRILPIVGRSDDGVPVFGEPSPEDARMVMIKKFFKPVIDDQLLQGTKENPYLEILRMKQLAGKRPNGGDGGRTITANDHLIFGEEDGFVKDLYANDHVLGCIDAMKDDRYLYIITPFCKHGSLYNFLPLRPSKNKSVESQAKRLYCQMLENIKYLHHHGICHRDVDPGVSSMCCRLCWCVLCKWLYFSHISLTSSWTEFTELSSKR